MPMDGEHAMQKEPELHIKQLQVQHTFKQAAQRSKGGRITTWKSFWQKGGWKEERASVTEYPKLIGLKHQTCQPFIGNKPSNFWCLPEILSVSWLVVAWLQTRGPFLSLFIALLSFSLCCLLCPNFLFVTTVGFWISTRVSDLYSLFPSFISKYSDILI